MTRSLTILGATGSIGRSTAEWCWLTGTSSASRRSSAATMPQALAEVARRLGAQFAALADERGRRNSQRRIVRHRASPAGQAQSAVLEAVGARGRYRPCRDQRDRRAGADPRRPEAGPAHRARQQGEPRLRRRRLHGRCAPPRRRDHAGRFRAQCPGPGLAAGSNRGCGKGDHHRHRRPVPHLDARADRDGRRQARPRLIRSGPWARRSTSTRPPS